MRHNEVNLIVNYQLECIGMDMIGYRAYGWIRSSVCWGMRIDAGNQPLLFYSNSKDWLRQGFQIMNDVDSFGSFMNSFLIPLREEYPKISSIVFPLMSSGTAQNLDIGHVRSLTFHHRSLPDSCCLRYKTRDSSSTRQCICARSTSAQRWISPLSIRHGGINLFGRNPWTFQCVVLPRYARIEFFLTKI